MSGTGCGWLGQFHCGASGKVGFTRGRDVEESPDDVMKKRCCESLEIVDSDKIKMVVRIAGGG